VGLFGVRYAAAVPLRSAISVRAPVVERLAARGQRVGYGGARAPVEGQLAVVRCGYGDGFPRVAWPERGILSVGMQYTIVTRVAGWEESGVQLVDAETDLDRFAATAGIGAHELVVRLGQGRAQHAHLLAGS
jgi:hypothetical protein